MCNQCVYTEYIGSSDNIVHGGYTDEDIDDFERLIKGDIVLEFGNGNLRRMSQEGWFKLWNKLESDGWGGLHGDTGCAVCDRQLVGAPAIEGECEVCGADKHKKIEEISENREEIKKEMEEFFGPQGPGPGKTNEPIELAVRAGLHCPAGHWVCSDCLTFRRGEID